MAGPDAPKGGKGVEVLTNRIVESANRHETIENFRRELIGILGAQEYNAEELKGRLIDAYDDGRGEGFGNQNLQFAPGFIDAYEQGEISEQQLKEMLLEEEPKEKKKEEPKDKETPVKKKEAPVVKKTPVEETPVDETPADEAPTDETPTDETPTDETPTNETPADETPADEAPTDETPADEAPADEAPTDETPTNETPTNETPTNETPADETPADEAPTDETPADEAPTDETPTNETPVDETPADETPVEETPVVEEKESRFKKTRKKIKEGLNNLFGKKEKKKEEPKDKETPVKKKEAPVVKKTPVEETPVVEEKDNEGRVIGRGQLDENGKKTGVWKEYQYLDATYVSEVTYKDGVKDGPFRDFGYSDKVREEGQYKNGIKIGKWTEYYKDSDDVFIYRIYDDKGTQISKQIFDGIGEIREESTYDPLTQTKVETYYYMDDLTWKVTQKLNENAQYQEIKNGEIIHTGKYGDEYFNPENMNKLTNQNLFENVAKFVVRNNMLDISKISKKFYINTNDVIAFAKKMELLKIIKKSNDEGKYEVVTDEKDLRNILVKSRENLNKNKGEVEENIDENNPPKDREVSADRINYIQKNIRNLYIPRNTIKKINDIRDDKKMMKKRGYEVNDVTMHISELMYYLNDAAYGVNFARTKDKSVELLEYCLKNQSNLMARDILNLKLEYASDEEMQKMIYGKI